MSHLTITVDGDTLMDGDTGDWTYNPPQQVMNQLNGQTVKPYSRALLVAMADHALASRNATITITTRDGGWTLDVQH